MYVFDQVRNEIHVLKKVSKGCTNIVTLHDYFEVMCLVSFKKKKDDGRTDLEKYKPDGTQSLSRL